MSDDPPHPDAPPEEHGEWARRQCTSGCGRCHRCHWCILADEYEELAAEIAMPAARLTSEEIKRAAEMERGVAVTDSRPDPDDPDGGRLVWVEIDLSCPHCGRLDCTWSQ
jgi:hypothetical protein